MINEKSQAWENWPDEDQRRLEFYQQFIRAGDLVFDAGANYGNRSREFLNLGARVIAVDPQRECAEYLESAYGNFAGFHCIRKALGATSGSAQMLISNAHTLSSLSPDWVQAVQDSGRFSGYRWNQSESVSTDTLDNLIAQFGLPSFIKIDVEGFEDQVIAGLSIPVRCLSFEFVPEFLHGTIDCIEHLRSIGNYLFQVSLGESMEFALANWIDAEQIKIALSKVPAAAFGDVYARLDAP